MAMTMVAGALAGCGNTAKSEPVESTVEEAVEESTEEAVEETSEASEEVAEVVEEEVVEEKPAREVKIYTYDDGKYGPYEIPSFDEDNVYMKKLRDTYNSDVYPGAYIAKEDSGWIWYFEPETDDGNYLYVGGVYDSDYLQGDELDSFMKEIDTNLDTFINKCESGELSPVDLDEKKKTALL